MTDNKTAADIALEAIHEGEEIAANTTVHNSKYKPGLYRSDKFFRIIKKLSYQNKLDHDGVAQQTYGTWAKESNMITFQKGVEKRLTEEDLQLSAIQRLIDSKAIYRVGD